ncbi:hypothetical protein RFI_07583, partial [Reticulomyxa filosa]
MNKIVTAYDAIRDNYRVSYTSEIMTQLKSSEETKKFDTALLARFAHCVSFTILRLSYEFIQSYWDTQLQNLQKPFGLNKETAQRYFQTVFQEQFTSSLTQLLPHGKQFINSKLKQQLIKKKKYRQCLVDVIINEIEKEDSKLNTKKHALMDACLRSMWSCLLSRPSLKPYPLEFNSSSKLNDEIKSKKAKINKEILGKESGCNDIGYFTWPTLIRCDTQELLNIPIAVCCARFNVNQTNDQHLLKNDSPSNNSITSNAKAADNVKDEEDIQE